MFFDIIERFFYMYKTILMNLPSTQLPWYALANEWLAVNTDSVEIVFSVDIAEGIGQWHLLWKGTSLYAVCTSFEIKDTGFCYNKRWKGFPAL